MYGDYMKIPDEADRVSHAELLLPFEACKQVRTLTK